MYSFPCAVMGCVKLARFCGKIYSHIYKNHFCSCPFTSHSTTMNAPSIPVRIVGLLIHTLALTQIRRVCGIPSSMRTRNAAEITMASTNFNDSHSRRTKLVASWNTSDTTEMIQRNSKIVPQWQAGNKKNVLHMHFPPKLSWKSILIYGSVYWYTVVEKLTVNGNSTENKSFILKLHLSTFL